MPMPTDKLPPARLLETASPDIGVPGMRLRTNFAGAHLRAAAQAACNASDIEKNSFTPNALGPWFDEMITLVPVSIVMAGAALEANANELIQDILDGAALTDARKLLLEALKEDHTGNSLGKYRRVALFLDKVPDEGLSPWQNAKILVDFRNYFMHFKPVWEDPNSTQTRLVAALHGKLPIAGPYQKEHTFPYAYLTYKCAKWSIETVLALSQYASGILGVKDRFSGWQSPRPLP
jgi:hypothetical protein